VNPPTIFHDGIRVHAFLCDVTQDEGKPWVHHLHGLVVVSPIVTEGHEDTPVPLKNNNDTAATQFWTQTRAVPPFLPKTHRATAERAAVGDAKTRISCVKREIWPFQDMLTTRGPEMSVERVFAVIAKLVAVPPAATVDDALAAINTFETYVWVAARSLEACIPDGKVGCRACPVLLRP
jgi:hypothetical protein